MHAAPPASRRARALPSSARRAKMDVLYGHQLTVERRRHAHARCLARRWRLVAEWRRGRRRRRADAARQPTPRERERAARERRAAARERERAVHRRQPTPPRLPACAARRGCRTAVPVRWRLPETRDGGAHSRRRRRRPRPPCRGVDDGAKPRRARLDRQRERASPTSDSNRRRRASAFLRAAASRRVVRDFARRRRAAAAAMRCRTHRRKPPTLPAAFAHAADGVRARLRGDADVDEVIAMYERSATAVLHGVRDQRRTRRGRRRRGSGSRRRSAARGAWCRRPRLQPALRRRSAPRRRGQWKSGGCLEGRR